MSQSIRDQGGHLVFPIGPKNTNLVEDVEILLPVKFRWIPFSGFRGEVENVSANQRPGRPSCFSDRPEKHKLGRGRWDLASCQVSLNSVQWFQRRSRKCLSQSEDRAAILFFPIGPKKHKLGRGRWDVASCQVTLNSVQGFQSRSRKCGKLTTDGQTDRRTDDGQRVITIVHLSLWLRCTKNTEKFDLYKKWEKMSGEVEGRQGLWVWKKETKKKTRSEVGLKLVLRRRWWEEGQSCTPRQ